MASVIHNDAQVTGAEAAAWFRQRGQHITRRTISDWRRAGHVTPVGQLPNGWPLYRFGDLIKVEGDTRMSGHSHRKQLQHAAA
jgi:hypothetical protein